MKYLNKVWSWSRKYKKEQALFTWVFQPKFPTLGDERVFILPEAENVPSHGRYMSFFQRERKEGQCLSPIGHFSNFISKLSVY